jgi:hypothetical protein
MTDLAKNNVSNMKQVKDEDLTDEQKYLKNQVVDLRNKQARLQFELDQINASLNVFEKSLIHSMKKAADEILNDEKTEKVEEK